MTTIFISAVVSIAASGQIYGIAGSELDLAGGEAGPETAQYDILIGDHFEIDDMDFRIKAHVVGDLDDSLSMDFEISMYPVTVDPPPPVLVFYDHNCYTHNFNTIDLRFSDEEDEFINEVCESTDLSDVINVDRLGDPIDEVLFGEEPMTVYDYLTADQQWRIVVSFKPFFNDWPDKNVVIDSLFLIFNDSDEIGVVENVGIDEDNVNNKFTFYPNPAGSEREVVVNYSIDNYSINLYDLSGKRVFTQNDNSSTTTISTNGLASGSYIIEVRSNDIIKREKLVIQ